MFVLVDVCQDALITSTTKFGSFALVLFGSFDNIIISWAVVSMFEGILERMIIARTWSGISNNMFFRRA